MRTPPFRLNWTQLLSDQRQRPAMSTHSSKKAPHQPARTAFEHDYDRIVFSAPFRRLAKKMQVHPFAEVDQIHNRLTHTLEVASVGRSLGAAAYEVIAKHDHMPPNRSREDIICIVQVACLAHDMGNPPFGHAGEAAIREWSKEHEALLFDALIPSDSVRKAITRDWTFFEGNAQGFRMMARADNRDQLYFLLTYAALGSMIKYPWTSSDPRVEREEKMNVFSSEAAIFDDLATTLGLRCPDGRIVRHPLSFLSEAADDICYRICDFEDAVQMHILPEKEVRKIFCTLIGQPTPGPLSALRAKAIGSLIRATNKAFKENYEAIMTGQRDCTHDLKRDFPKAMQKGLDDIRKRYPDIFNHRRKVASEIGAYTVLGKILDHYTKAVRALVHVGAYKKLTYIQKRCLELAWGAEYVIANQKQDYAWWLGRVLDYVSGMTDNYATRIANEIEGV
jgi:dGTPase